LWRYFLELHGDRGFKDDKAMIGGLEKLVVNLYDCWSTKGYNTKTVNTETLANPEGYRKRCAKMAEKFGIPVLTLIDTRAYPGLEAEERGQGEAIARNIFEMVRLKCLLLPLLLVKQLGGALGIEWRSRLYAGKHLVFCNFSRILFFYFMEKLGI
jgi:acetyl-CoA carboxylase carboxyl transferase subunit alpha